MFDQRHWDVTVIGAGPAGLAAALSAQEQGASVCVIERDQWSGGILKQCIHDGFGLIRFKEKLTGPEYAQRYLESVQAANIPLFLNTFLDALNKEDDYYILRLINSQEGLFLFKTAAVVLATGCRERSAQQIFIHGTRPAGVLTAGLAQYFINIQGYMPTKRCVILGSGDIGLIMARRLVLEGAAVQGVYEILPEPSGLARNVAQCLGDYDIPLHLSCTVTRVHGTRRVQGVTVCKVDANLQPLAGTEQYIECDALILSVGLIPENELAESLDLEMDPFTKGPKVDQNFMTTSPGVFSCGNALHVNDLVDYVSEAGEIAGRQAALYARQGGPGRDKAALTFKGDLLYMVPQYLDFQSVSRAVFYFRSSRTLRNATLNVSAAGGKVLSRKYPVLRPPELQRFSLDLAKISFSRSSITMELQEDESHEK